MGEIQRGITKPPLWDDNSPWSACILEGTAESEGFWDEHVRHPALAWLAAGKKGNPTAPGEESARQIIKEHSPESSPSPRRRRGRRGSRGGRGGRRQDQGKHAKDEREETPPPPPYKSQRRGNRDGAEPKGKGKGNKRTTKARKYDSTVDGKPLCFAWNAKTGKCTEFKGPCVNGRVHACTNCRSPNHRASENKC